MEFIKVNDPCLFITVDDPDLCRVGGRIYSNKETSKEDCNTCTCNKGIRSCTKVLCGPKNCYNASRASGHNACGLGDVCKPKEGGCLKPPCATYGECTGVKSTSIGGGVIGDDVCLPNTTVLSGDCAKINILLNVQKIPKVCVNGSVFIDYSIGCLSLLLCDEPIKHILGVFRAEDDFNGKSFVTVSNKERVEHIVKKRKSTNIARIVGMILCNEIPGG